MHVSDVATSSISREKGENKGKKEGGRRCKDLDNAKSILSTPNRRHVLPRWLFVFIEFF